MNKKAIFMGLMIDIWGWFILFLGIIFWIMVFALFKHNVAYEIEGETAYLKDNGQFLTFLSSPADNTNIADFISRAYETGDNGVLNAELNTLLNSVYGRAKPVCWKLWYYEGEDKKLLAEEDCENKKNIFDARATIPLRNSEVMDIRLNVLGYKE